ncbi:DNA-processing protein DprA [Candidatus Cytomitobacter primus]|uniref:DNA-protecting protein DprA n=1 Tax=Candidatus Cytomitobacter primus TaxID=2066024 RepID=A0A5C0UFH8_9PROT|nr:DNA-processing protein DprA [Candidatus Cytomitobacter primus]QEK38470.1 DNA-protecting protein DprA [Candidatus Cytomitobacter primus]
MNIKQQMSIEEKIDFLRVIRTKNIGPISFLHLLHTYKTIDRVIQYLETKMHVCSKNTAIAEIKKINDYGAQLVAFSDPEYPSLLRNMRDYPPIICVKGNLDLLSSKKLFSIAGSRACSLQSQVITKKIALEMGEQGYKIVSGLARGIDTIAHQNSINTGTIAVLANGIDHIYPSENKNLYDKIADQGLLLSEVAFGTRPSSHLFPNRNRIIAGMSLGVLVVEAGLKSGSLITAQCAVDNGREVFAIPGCPLDPRSRGTNKLIKQGAILVEFSYDILNSFASFSLKEPKSEYIPDIKQNTLEEGLIDQQLEEKDDKLVGAKDQILKMIGFFPISIELLINKMNLPVRIVKSLLVQLEIEGHIQHLWGNKVALKDKNQTKDFQ